MPDGQSLVSIEKLEVALVRLVVVVVFILFCLVLPALIMAEESYIYRYKPTRFWNIRKIRLECCEF